MIAGKRCPKCRGSMFPAERGALTCLQCSYAEEPISLYMVENLLADGDARLNGSRRFSPTYRRMAL